MNFSLAVFLINKDCRAIITEYDPDNSQDKRVLYKTLDPRIKVGDLVVIPTNTRHKFSLVKVVEVDVPVDYDSPLEAKWLVSPALDTTEYNQIVADEAAAIVRLRQRDAKQRTDALRKTMFGEDQSEIASLPLYRASTPAT